MNRRTFLATTSLALVSRLPNRKRPSTDTSADTDTRNDLDGDPLTLEDILITADILPADWTRGSVKSSTPAHRDGSQQSTATGLKSRKHPQTNDRIASMYAKRRFIRESNLPSEFEYLDVGLEVASTGEHARYDNRGEAIQALHDTVFAAEVKNWQLTTGWVDADISSSSNQLRRRSVASMRKPLCAVPADIELSTGKPLIETAVVVAPLPWGVAVVTGTLTDPNEPGLARELVTHLANRVAAMGRASPPPLEARR